MNKEQLHPDIRKEIASLPTLPFHRRRLLPVARWLYDIAAKSKPVNDVRISNLKHDGLKIRIYTPETIRSNAGIFWIHGGGYVAGKPSHLDGAASLAARALGIQVFAPTYRLAPKYPFPSGLEDIRRAWDYLSHGARALNINKALHINPASIAIAGNSAGGGLAAALVQQLTDDKQAINPVAQCLFYPMLDDRTAANPDYDQPKRFVWSNNANRVAWDCYLHPAKAGDKQIRNYASPARTRSLDSIPPTWLGICDLDLFHDENQEYAQRLKNAGAECHVHLVKGAPHAFEVIKPQAVISKQMMQSALDFLKTQLV